jgi:outer membrane protein assembly factor BamD
MGNLIPDNRKKISIILFLIFLAGCAGKTDSVKMDPTEYFERAKIALEKKRYETAIDNFNMVLLNSPGGELADDAQYYLGECYFKKKDYLLAVSEYQQLTERYSYSPLAEEGYYKIALSYYMQSPKYSREQTSTLRALQYFQDFIDAYPASEYRPDAEQKIRAIRNKLARKIYESGKLYRKLEYFDACIFYQDEMLEEFYDTDWVIPALLEKAHCYIRLRQFDEYHAIVNNLSKSEVTPEIEKRLGKQEKLYNRELRRIAREERRQRRR